MHYLVFDFGNNTMRLHSDANRDKAFTSVDPVVGEPTPLPGNVYFDRVCGQTSGAPYVAFQPDGSITFRRSGGAGGLDFLRFWSIWRECGGRGVMRFAPLRRNR